MPAHSVSPGILLGLDAMWPPAATSCCHRILFPDYILPSTWCALSASEPGTRVSQRRALDTGKVKCSALTPQAGGCSANSISGQIKESVVKAGTGLHPPLRPRFSVWSWQTINHRHHVSKSSPWAPQCLIPKAISRGQFAESHMNDHYIINKYGWLA